MSICLSDFGYVWERKKCTEIYLQSFQSYKIFKCPLFNCVNFISHQISEKKEREHCKQMCYTIMVILAPLGPGSSFYVNIMYFIPPLPTSAQNIS